MSARAWIAVDWGTTHLRVWEMSADDRVVQHHSSADGMATLGPEGFAPALRRLVGELDVPVIACGMVGSRQGWIEAPYLEAPCPPPSVKQAARVGRVHILPGIKQVDPADVMRGEETQIAGFLSEVPDFKGVLCLPGTHCKWARIADGQVVSFKTVMTGEMFGWLTGQSVLRHVMDGGWDDGAFHAAVAASMAQPDALMGRLFEIRADGLLNGVHAGRARAQVSGYLIGAELAATRRYWQDTPIVVLGASGLAARYLDALTTQGAAARAVDGERFTLAGLIAAKSELAPV